MTLDLAPAAAANAPPTTVWVRTATGVMETTMPRPPPGVGPAGPQGPKGDPGQSLTLYEYNYATGSSPPPAQGTFRTNAATPQASTVVWVHRLDVADSDWRNVLLLAKTGATLYVQDVNDSKAFAEYRLTADAADATDYVTFAVSLTRVGVGLLSGARCLLGVLIPGPQGPKGDTGAQGPPGPQGPAGVAPDEVFIGPNDPGAAYELWVDSDAEPTPIALPAYVPRGVVGRGSQPGGQGSIGTAEVDVTGCAVTWTADPTRRYRVTARVTLQKLSAAGQVYAAITDAANARKVATFATGAVNDWLPLYVEAIESNLNGSTTRKLRALCDAGTAATAGTNEFLGNLTVEDIGGV